MSNIPLKDIRDIRIGKAETLRKMGINPYPSKASRTHYAKVILDHYEVCEGKTVTVSGRLMSVRTHGALTFGHIQDQTGRIQLYIRTEVLQPTDPAHGFLGYSDLNLLDIGDFVEGTGIVTKTQRGEISVQPTTIRLLGKSIRPLPDKWAGLKDREAILRRRYLDTIIQPTHKETFDSISKMLYAIRTFLNERGYVEFITPILQPQYGGGTAKPFVTYANALGCEMYLAISHELYLKRLIAAGYDKVFTIGRYFRNEGIDRSHHPEFSMIETMAAYQNYEYNMDLIEEMFRHVAQSAFGKTEFLVRGHAIDFGKPWKRISMNDAVLAATKHDFAKCSNLDQANSILTSLKIGEPQPTMGAALAKAFEIIVEPTLVEPTLLYGHPMDISPLAKPMDSDPRFAERFEIFIAGMECGDNWSEQNDPINLLNRWAADFHAEGKAEDEFHPLDYDFIEALECGIPPTSGIGPGLERMAMIFTGNENIDEVIFFPMMKPTLSEINAAIYGIDELPSHQLNKDDVFITLDEFTTLVKERRLQPENRNISVYPYARVWKSSELNVSPKTTMYLEIERFISNKRLRVTGYPLGEEDKLATSEERHAFKDRILRKLIQSLIASPTKCNITVEEIVVLDAMK